MRRLLPSFPSTFSRLPVASFSLFLVGACGFPPLSVGSLDGDEGANQNPGSDTSDSGTSEESTGSTTTSGDDGSGTGNASDGGTGGTGPLTADDFIERYIDAKCAFATDACDCPQGGEDPIALYEFCSAEVMESSGLGALFDSPDMADAVFDAECAADFLARAETFECGIASREGRFQNATQLEYCDVFRGRLELGDPCAFDELVFQDTQHGAVVDRCGEGLSCDGFACIADRGGPRFAAAGEDCVDEWTGPGGDTRRTVAVCDEGYFCGLSGTCEAQRGVDEDCDAIGRDTVKQTNSCQPGLYCERQNSGAYACKTGGAADGEPCQHAEACESWHCGQPNDGSAESFVCLPSAPVCRF